MNGVDVGKCRQVNAPGLPVGLRYASFPAAATPVSPILLPNHALPQAKTPITPPIPMMLTTDPNDSATHPKALMPSMEVAVAMAVYTAITRPTIPGGATS